MPMTPVQSFASTYRPYMLEAQKLTQWSVTFNKTGDAVQSVETGGFWNYAPAKRGWHASNRIYRPLVRTKTSARVSDRRFMGYGTVIYLRDLESPRTINAWLKSMMASPLTTKGVVSGVFIEGINFNLDDAEIVTRARAMFTDLTTVARDMTGGDDAELFKGNGSDYSYSALTAYETDSFDGVDFAILHKDGNGNAFTNGYIRVGKVVVTNLPSMGALARTLLHQEALAAENKQSVDREARFRAAWLDRLLSDIRKRQDKANAKVEKLAAQLREASRELGEARLLLSVAENNTDAVLAESLGKIRNIPETESVTIDNTVFKVITTPMKAVLARTGEERYCGKFEIQIHLNGAVRVRNIASPDESYRNPHGGCTGSYNGVFSNALAAFDYYALVLSIMEYYRTFDPHHESRWIDLPTSLKAPKKVYVSDWQYLVGSWSAATVAGNGSKLVKAGAALHHFLFTTEDAASDTVVNFPVTKTGMRRPQSRRVYR